MSTFEERYQAALVAISGRNWREAEALLRDLATNYQPLIPQIGYNLALVLREMGDAAKASESSQWLQRVLNIQPDYHNARFELAAHQMDHGDLESALDNFRLYLEAVPEEPDALKNSGMLAVRLGLWREAKDWLDRCLEIRPDDPDVLLARAHLARETGDLQRAEAIYRKLFKDEIPLRPLILKSMTQGSSGRLPLNENGLIDDPDP